jgi:hypothetical protein
MEYHRLSKEQLEELHQEFAKYLAALSIDRKQWEEIKANDPQTVDLHLDQFSDLVWGDVLSKDLYLEHLSPNHFFIFECLEKNMNLIAVKITNVEQDITTPEGWQWLLHHIHDESVTFYRSSKDYDHDRKEELYGMIIKGAQISSDKRFKSILEFLA